jgi:hypothetical protein
MKQQVRSGFWTIFIFLVAASAVAQTQAPADQAATAPQAEQTTATSPTPEYKPKFKGDPAHSDAEASALGYMRTLVTAEKLFYKKHAKYTRSLQELAASPGSFTRRMANTDRGDYQVDFHPQGKDGQGYTLALTPKSFDAQHRAFFTDDSGVIRVDDAKPATEESPKL